MSSPQANDSEKQVYDLIVIGAGSGGVRAARIAAGHGAKVAIVEAADLGGTCVNLGCVPKKLLTYAAHFATDFKDAAGYGWTVNSQFHWPELIKNKNAEIKRLNRIYETMLHKAGVTIIRGLARYLKVHQASHEIAVEQSDITQSSNTSPLKLRAKRLLFATGGKAVKPDCIGQEHLVVSDDLFYLPELPRKIVIIGAGYIGLEFASIFAGLGVEVHIMVRSQSILRGFEDQLGQWLEASLPEQGIHLHKGAVLRAVKQLPDGFAFDYSQAGEHKSMQANLVVAATGRVPNVPQGVEASVPDFFDTQGYVQVNERFETSLPGLYAIGDLIPGPDLTPVAIKQGHWLADSWFGPASESAKPPLVIPSIPTAVFTYPAMATVGHTEAELRNAGQAFKVYQSEFRPMKHTLAQNPLKVGIKLLVSDNTVQDNASQNPAEQKVLGMHMIGEDAPEIIQGLAVAFDMGVTKAQLDQTLGIHPTVGEEWVTLR